MNPYKLPLLCLLASALSIQAQTVTVTNLNWRPAGNAAHPNGIYSGTPSAGTLNPQPPATDFSGYTAADPGDFLFRLGGLTLDGAGANDDYIDFTIRFSSANGTSTGNITFAGDGIGINGDVGGGIDENEEMTVEVVNVSLKPGMLGTVDFDGFTQAGFFAAASAGAGNTTTFDMSANINGTPVTVSKSGVAYQFGESKAIISPASPMVIMNNVSRTATTATPTGKFRSCDFGFTYTAASGAPELADFSLAASSFPTEETEGYFFTSGTPGNTEDTVYELNGLELYYDVSNVTQITLKRDGAPEQVIPIPGGTAADVVTPNVPTTPGVYQYTLEITNGVDTVTSAPVSIAVQQPLDIVEASTRSSASKIGKDATLPLFIKVDGDFDSTDVNQGLFLTFADQAGLLTPASAGGSGNPAPGNLTTDFRNSSPTPFYSDNLFTVATTGRLDVPASAIITAIQTANGGAPLTFPFSARATITAVNPVGSSIQTIDFVIEDTRILVELDPSTFAADSNVLNNQFIGPFLKATEIANNEIVDVSSGSVTFTKGFAGLASMNSDSIAFSTLYKFRDVTISTWVEIPEAPVNGLILKLGDNNAGVSLGYEVGTGELIGLMRAGFLSDTVTRKQSQANAAITTGWHHIAMVLNIGTDANVSLYIDGTLAATGNTVGEPETAVTSWASTQICGIFTSPGAQAYAGQEIPLFGGSTNGLNGIMGNLRMYNGILDAPFVANLATEFLGSGTSELKIVSADYNGGSFSVTVSGLQSGTTYYLRRNAGLSGGLSAFLDVSSLTATSDTETFTDVSPLAGKGFYVVSDASNPAP